MYYHEDWLMRQIEAMTNSIVQLLLHKNDSTLDKEIQAFFLQEDNSLSDKLDLFISQGKICEAEDYLYEKLATEDDKFFYTAIMFYNNLNKLSNKELELYNFSREEIESGIKDICKKCGVDIPILCFDL